MIMTFSVLFTPFFMEQGTMEINVKDIKSNEGQIVLLIFNNEDEFGVKKEPFKKIIRTTISNNEVLFSLTDIETGEYAFLIFHDVDNNGICKTNWFGMPKEGVGKSGNAGDIPRFENSKFQFNGEHKTFNIKMKYL
jgi:uncharacterized protein (DUF2141 family)